jgi:hypothetical protein
MRQLNIQKNRKGIKNECKGNCRAQNKSKKLNRTWNYGKTPILTLKRTHNHKTWIWNIGSRLTKINREKWGKTSFRVKNKITSTN